jgi:Ca2+-binding EF-hand superfamily protein
LLHYSEFVAIISRKVDPAYTRDQVKHAFLVFQDNTNARENEHDNDNDNDNVDDSDSDDIDNFLTEGHVHFDSLLEGILEFTDDKAMSEEKATLLLKQLHFNEEGTINIVEYIDLMMR